MSGSRTNLSPEILIEQCTEEKNTEENWSTILEVCEQITPENSRKILGYILSRVFHKNPHVSKQAITLLDACMKNSCSEFQNEVVSGALFRREAKKSLSTMHQKNRAHLLKTINSWSSQIKTKESPKELLDSISCKAYSAEMLSLVPEESQAERKKNAMREEAELVNAIAASLQVTKGQGTVSTANTSAYSSSGSAYPTLTSALSTATNRNPSGGQQFNGSKEPKKVRALYDFEAAEDNELTFKAGEIILVSDDSDANWWKGSNQRGEGLFPSSFVVSLDKEGSEGITSQVSSHPSESRQESVVTVAEKEVCPLPPPRIDEALLDQCLEMLGEADPTAVDDSAMPDLPGREAQCHAMGPLIDAELERIDREHYELMDLNKRLMEAMQMYNTLMTTSSIAAAPMGQLGVGNIPMNACAPQGMWPVGNAATGQPYEAVMGMSQQQMGVGGAQSGMVPGYGAPYYGGPLSQGSAGASVNEAVQSTTGYTNPPYNVVPQYSNNPMSGSYQPSGQLQFQTQQQQHEWMMSQAQSQGQYQNIAPAARRGMPGVGYDSSGQYATYGSPINTAGSTMQGGFYQPQTGIVTSQSGWTPPNPQAY